MERSENLPVCLTKSVFLNKLQRSLKVKDDTCLRTQLILILLFRLFLSSLALLLMHLCFPRLETPWGLGNWENMYFSIGSQSVRLPGLQSGSTLKKKVYYYPLEANMVKACYNNHVDDWASYPLKPFCERTPRWDLAGGPAARTRCSQWRGLRFDSWLGV